MLENLPNHNPPPHRRHRARSSVALSDSDLVEVRAAQRTFEGAYIRTALGQFSFALVILKIFTTEFYSIAALFASYGAGLLLTSVYRRQHGNEQLLSEIRGDGVQIKKFKTSGATVFAMTVLTFLAYAIMIGLVLRLAD